MLLILFIIPLYVAKLDLEFAETGLWSISTALGFCFKNSSLINVLLPAPATPVTRVNTPLGILIDTFLNCFYYNF